MLLSPWPALLNYGMGRLLSRVLLGLLYLGKYKGISENMLRSPLATIFPGCRLSWPGLYCCCCSVKLFLHPSPQFSTETFLWRGPGLGSICATAAASLEPPWMLSEDARALVQLPFLALCFKTLDLNQPVHHRLINITAHHGAACSQPSATGSQNHGFTCCALLLQGSE